MSFARLAVALTLPALLVMYTETMVVPSLQMFMEEFNVSEADVAWILTAYLLSGVATTPLLGKLAPGLGYRRTLVLTLLIYATGLTLCSFSKSFSSLIASRVVQGLGMAMFPVAFSIVRELLPPRQVVLLQGILSAMFGIGSVVGLVVGSHVAETFGWRALFRSAAILAWTFALLELVLLPEIKRGPTPRLDLTGALLFSLGVALLCFAFERAAYLGWDSLQVWLALVAGLLSLYAFTQWELVEEEPFIDIRRLREVNVLVSNIAGVIAGFAMFVFFQLSAIHMRMPKPVGLGLSIAEIGTYMTVPAITMIVVAAVFSRLAVRIGIKRLLLISGVAGACTSLLFLVIDLSSLWQFVGACSALMAAVGVQLVSIINLLVLSVAPEETALMTSVNMVLRYVGGSLGAAVAGYLQDTITETITVVTPLGPIPLVVPSPDAVKVGMILVALLSLLITLIGIKAREVIVRERA